MKFTKEHWNKLSQAHKGKIPWNKGKILPHRINLSLSHLGKNSGPLYYRWKNGIVLRNGYVYVMNKKHPYAKYDPYIKRCRIVMEKHLGRYLKPSEIIHHINQNKKDDRIKNLQIVTRIEHNRIHQNLWRIA